jgi:hypothetical protein
MENPLVESVEDTPLEFVMPGLVPGIHAFVVSKTWMHPAVAEFGY